MKRIFLVLSSLLFVFLLTGCDLFSGGQQPGGQHALQMPPTPVATHDLAPVPDLYDSSMSGLYGLDAGTGKVLWHNPTLVTPGLVTADGENIYASEGNSLSALDAQNGAVRWIWTSTSEQHQDTPTLLVGPDTVYFIEGSDVFASAGPQYPQGDTHAPPVVPAPSTVVALDATTGKVRWQHTLKYRLNDPVIDNDVIYGIGSTTLHGTLYALKGSDGSVLWQQPFAQTSSLYYDGLTADGMLFYAKMGTDVSAQLALSAFSLKDGQKLWQSNQPMTGSSTSQITSAGGVLYYAVEGHDLYAFNARNGGLLWSRTFSTAINTGMLPLANGKIYLNMQATENQPVLATWDIRSENRPVVQEEGGFLANEHFMCVQSTQSTLHVRSDFAPIFTKKRFHWCGLCLPR